uniref:G-protein coupled receptors family 1 profile domain-containing protein n=1 Tax=Acrobeloides nanus TaxID=290746 RepID=A0A914CQK4_9BILA
MEQTTSMEIQNVDEYYSCDVQYSPDRRWYLVAVAGTSLSVVSFICNLLIARILLRMKYSHFFFLGLLALSDAFLSFCYGPVIAMDVIKNRLQLLWLTRLYWSYVGPSLALCQVSIYLITVKSSLLSLWRSKRGLLALFMFILALLSRGTAVFEIEVKKNGDCTGLTEYEPRLNDELVKNWLYGTLFRFYLRNIVAVFIPFFLLAYLNFLVVMTLRKQHMATMFQFGASEHKQKVRSATRLLVLIVCSYLLANVLNVLITAWEYVDFDSTQDENLFDVYEILTDVISVLYILICASRLFVYISCNEEIRNAFYEFFCPQKCSTKTAQHRKIRKISSNLRPQFGTEFDRVALAIAGTMMVKINKSSTDDKYDSYGTTTIIENPLAEQEESIAVSDEHS